MKNKHGGMGGVVGLAILGMALASPAGFTAPPGVQGSDGIPLRMSAGACLRGEEGAAPGECWHVPDRDGDGVRADQDQCPDTPRGAVVDHHGCAPDADRDTVTDVADQCPDTSYGVRVDRRGCPLDLDGDGVAYYLDRCPTTPPGAEVDVEGCPLKLVLQDILFAFNRSELKPAARALLDPLLTSLEAQPEVRALRITGHTDNVGSAAYNQRLSEARARTVMSYLQQHGLTLPVIASGLGETRPLASNAHREGRARNRRVEIDLLHR